jgi:hypothetical protein
MRSGGLTLDAGRRIAQQGGRRLDLSTKELAVLELLMAASNSVVSPEELLARAWDEAVDPFSAVVKVAISRLRRRKPFVRAPADHNGHGNGNGRGHPGDGLGLGLSIVQAIADAHGPPLVVSALPEGGLRVSVAFPAPLTGYEITPCPPRTQ